MRSIALFLFLLPALTACMNGPIGKAMLDKEVDRLCAIDGGIKVYETVKLPPDKFNKSNRVIFDVPGEDAKKPGSEYFYTHEIIFYKKGNPDIYRSNFKLYKLRKDFLLGETVTYGRRGGDAMGPWHESYYRCPLEADIVHLKKSVFIPDTGE